MNQNKIVAFLMASIVAISIVAIATPALGSEDRANVEEKHEVMIDKTPGSEPEPKKPEEPDESEPEVREPDPRFNPVFREVVIIYFNEMPASLDEFASDYSVKLIFVKEDIKMAAFETEPSSMPMETSQRTLDFVEEVSRNSRVEKVYKDGFMFVRPDKDYTPELKIIYPENLDKHNVAYIPNEVVVGFWRLPPSLEEFASRYGAKLKNFGEADEVLLSALFETDDITEFIKRVSTDPYVSYIEPNGVVHGSYTPGDPKSRSTDPSVQPAEPNNPKWNQQWGGPEKMSQRRHNTQKLGNTRKAATSIKDNTKVLTAVHKKIPVIKEMDISECREGALYKYPNQQEVI